MQVLPPADAYLGFAHHHEARRVRGAPRFEVTLLKYLFSVLWDGSESESVADGSAFPTYHNTIQ